MVERLYRPREVAEMLGISAKTAQKIMREQMRCINLGGANAKHKTLAVTMPELERWQAESPIEPSGEHNHSASARTKKKPPKRIPQSVPDRIPRRRPGQ